MTHVMSYVHSELLTYVRVLTLSCDPKRDQILQISGPRLSDWAPVVLTVCSS
jgi:hypothetical protein